MNPAFRCVSQVAHQQHMEWAQPVMLFASPPQVRGPPTQVISCRHESCDSCHNFLASTGLCDMCPLLQKISDLETQLDAPNAPVIHPQGGCSFSDSALGQTVHVMCSDLNGWGNPCDATLYVTIDGTAPRFHTLNRPLSRSRVRTLSPNGPMHMYLKDMYLKSPCMCLCVVC